MKKKREAKRQAKLEEAENSADKQDVNITDKTIDNEKQLKIKKIQSVCLFINILIYN